MENGKKCPLEGGAGGGDDFFVPFFNPSLLGMHNYTVLSFQAILILGSDVRMPKDPPPKGSLLSQFNHKR